jgi:sugar/nucleoside kinase (ribokinase family)
MITHSSEVIVGSEGRIYRAPLTPRNLSGRTGRGDTCFAAYLTRRLSDGIQQSVDYAAALVSLKMERPGPFRGTDSEVRARMQEAL